jgi:hypothetical protein
MRTAPTTLFFEKARVVVARALGVVVGRGAGFLVKLDIHAQFGWRLVSFPVHRRRPFRTVAVVHPSAKDEGSP